MSKLKSHYYFGTNNSDFLQILSKSHNYQPLLLKCNTIWSILFIPCCWWVCSQYSSICDKSSMFRQWYNLLNSQVYFKLIIVFWVLYLYSALFVHVFHSLRDINAVSYGDTLLFIKIFDSKTKILNKNWCMHTGIYGGIVMTFTPVVFFNYTSLFSISLPRVT